MAFLRDAGTKEVVVPASFGGSKGLRMPSLAIDTQTSELCFQFMCLSTLMVALKPVAGRCCPHKHRQLLLQNINPAAKRLLTRTAQVTKDIYCRIC